MRMELFSRSLNCEYLILYDEGLLLFSKYDGHSIISFRNDNWPERGFEKMCMRE